MKPCFKQEGNPTTYLLDFAGRIGIAGSLVQRIAQRKAQTMHPTPDHLHPHKYQDPDGDAIYSYSLDVYLIKQKTSKGNTCIVLS